GNLGGEQERDLRRLEELTRERAAAVPGGDRDRVDLAGPLRAGDDRVPEARPARGDDERAPHADLDLEQIGEAAADVSQGRAHVDRRLADDQAAPVARELAL